MDGRPFDGTAKDPTRGVSRRRVLLSAAVALAGRGPARARASQATPAAITDDLLLEARFAADELPAGPAQGFFYRMTLPPGETLPYLVGPFCGCGNEQVAPGVGAELVRNGAYAVRLDAPFRVRRADGADEEVAAGAEVVLEAGDAATFADYAAPGELRAAGTEPAVVVGVAVTAVARTGTPAPRIPVAVEAEELSALTEAGWADVAAGGPVALRLRRVVLPAGAALVPYETAGAEAMAVEAGEGGSSVLPPGATTPPGKPLAYRAGSTAPFLVLQRGNRRLVANDGDEAAVLLVASIGPVGGLLAAIGPTTNRGS